MHDPNTRRSFLRGLTTLPLIGGGVTLIGNPTKAAELITPELLDAYSEWLFYERRMLCIERYGDRDAEGFVPANTGAHLFHFPPSELGGWKAAPKPSVRAAVVLSAVGCDWREDDRHG